jgi:hypothetical protein
MMRLRLRVTKKFELKIYLLLKIEICKLSFIVLREKMKFLEIKSGFMLIRESNQGTTKPQVM